MSHRSLLQATSGYVSFCTVRHCRAYNRDASRSVTCQWMLCVAVGLHRRVAGLRAPFRRSSAQRQVVQAQVGAFSKLPYVPPADELLQTAIKRSSRLSPSKSIKNEAQKAR